MEKWRPYLQHRPFVIRTDHRSLLHLTEQRLMSKIQHKALVKLMDLDYQIQYKKGITNAAADALSRCASNEVLAVSECVPSWLHKLTESYSEYPEDKELLKELAVNTNNEKGYSLQDGVIKYKDRIWVGHNVFAQQHILQALHASGVGGHSGISATYNRVKSLFAWPKLKQSVQQFVQQCQICQQAKVEHTKLPGLLQPLPVPAHAWEMVSMDFVEGLPTSDRYNAILVVIDKFSKYGHFVPIHHPFTAMQIAKVFLDNIYKLHGLPKVIISDRDPVFTSSLWKELFKLTDTQLLMSSSYHPQTDGQTERLNQCLEDFLRCTVHSCPRKWSHWLSVAEFWYNTAYHTALGKSPFQVLYGYSPRQLGISNPNLSTIPDLEQWMRDRDLLTKIIQQQLQRAQQRMKALADKHRIERSFEVGDLVYMKLQPYVQSSVAARSNKKLSFRYYGPYRVLQRIGEVAYKLDLPEGSKIHPVVHVSQLKKHVPKELQLSDDLSSVSTDPMHIYQPECILQTRTIRRGAKKVKQVLVKWTSLPTELATWEDEVEIPREQVLMG